MHNTRLLHLFLFSTLSFLSNRLQAQWEAAQAPGVIGVTFLQKCGDNLEAKTPYGSFYSPDGGLSWQKRRTAPGFDFRYHQGVYYCYFLGKFYKSTDLGVSWTLLASNLLFEVQPIVDFVVLGDTIFATDDYTVYRHIPDSSNWSVVLQDPDYAVPHLSYSNGQLWLAKKRIHRSTDAGNTWDDVTPAGVSLSSAVFHGDTIMACVKDSMGVYFSVNSGQTWELRSQVPGGTLYYGDGAYALLLYGQLYLSWDDGWHWKKTDEFPFQSFPNCVAFSNGAILLGMPEGLLRSLDQGDHWLYSRANLIPYQSPPGNYLTNLGDIALFAPQFQFSFDAGSHWFEPFLTLDIQAITRKADSLFIMTTYPATLLASTGNLELWDTLTLPATQGVCIAIAAAVDGLYAVVLNAGVKGIYFSNDYGTTWEFQGVLPFAASGDLNALDDLLFALGDGNEVYVSKTHGNTWEKKMDGATGPVRDIYVAGNDVYLWNDAGQQSLFYVSGDQGEHWSAFPPPIQRAVSYTAFNQQLFISDDQGNVFWIDGPNGEWTSIQDNLPGGIQQNTLGLQGTTLLFMDTKLSYLYRRNLNTLGKSTIQGKVFRDQNQNGLADSGESGIPNMPIKTTPEGNLNFTRPDGAFQITTGQLPTGLSITPATPYTIIEPVSHTVATTVDTQYQFGVYVIAGIKDLRVDVTLNTVLSPNRPAEYVATVRNLGSDSTVATPRFPLSPELTLVSTTPGYDHRDNDTLVWGPVVFPPQSVKKFVVRLLTPVGALPGATVVNGFDVPVFDDPAPLDNRVLRTDTIFAAFDPNFKESTPSKLTPALVAAQQPIEYTIHFQNTGNYPASIVRVEDTLSSLLSLASFQLIASSHPVRLETTGSSTLQFIFDNINLPDSARNEAGSHGFVKFSVRPQPGLVIGDQVHNQAFIYFDFNKAVATNRHVLPVIDPSVAAKDPAKAPLAVLVSPNPGSHTVAISWPQGLPEPLQLQVTDAGGRAVKILRDISGSRVLLDISTWATGQYWLELKDSKGRLLGNGKMMKI